MDGSSDGRVKRWMGQVIDGSSDGWAKRWTGQAMDGSSDGRVKRWTGQAMDRSSDGQTISNQFKSPRQKSFRFGTASSTCSFNHQLTSIKLLKFINTSLVLMRLLTRGFVKKKYYSFWLIKITNFLVNNKF